MAERQCAVGLLSLEKKKKLSFVSDGMTRRHHTFVRNRSLGKLSSETFLRFVPRSWWLSSTETEGETRDRWIGRRAELISAVDNLLPFCLSFFLSFLKTISFALLLNWLGSYLDEYLKTDTGREVMNTERRWKRSPFHHLSTTLVNK